MSANEVTMEAFRESEVLWWVQRKSFEVNLISRFFLGGDDIFSSSVLILGWKIKLFFTPYPNYLNFSPSPQHNHWIQPNHWPQWPRPSGFPFYLLLLLAENDDLSGGWFVPQCAECRVATFKQNKVSSRMTCREGTDFYGPMSSLVLVCWVLVQCWRVHPLIWDIYCLLKF